MSMLDNDTYTANVKSHAAAEVYSLRCSGQFVGHSRSAESILCESCALASSGSCDGVPSTDRRPGGMRGLSIDMIAVEPLQVVLEKREKEVGPRQWSVVNSIQYYR